MIEQLKLDDYILLKEFMKTIGDDAFRSGHFKRFKKHEFLAHKGNSIYRCFFILDGELSVYNEFDNGKIYNIEQIRAGMIVGEMEIVAKIDVFSATVVANTDVLVYSFTKESYHEWMNQSSEFIAQANIRLASMLCQISTTHGENIVYSSREVLARLLIRMYGTQPKATLILNDTRKDLSEKTGLSIRSINRVIRWFLDQNYLEISKGKILLNPKYIERLKSI